MRQLIRATAYAATAYLQAKGETTLKLSKENKRSEKKSAAYSASDSTDLVELVVK